MTIFLTTLAAVLTAIYIGIPFWRARAAATEESASSSQRDELELRRESLLRELKELEFDHRMGKIDDAEYQALRAQTAEATSQVLNQLEALQPIRVAVPEQSQHSQIDIDIEIEVLIARARRTFNATQSTADAVATDWTCDCGRAMSGKDRFCGSCGAPRMREVVSPK